MRVGIIDGCRTPFAKAGGDLSSASVLDLSIHAVREAGLRAGLATGDADLVVMGAATPDGKTPYLARETTIALDWGSTDAYSVETACATGARAIVSAAHQLLLGEAEVAIAGGAESMSHQPVTASDPVAQALRARGKGVSDVEALLAVSLRDLLPASPTVAEPYTGLSLGEHAEEIVRDWRITREASDELAVTSHHRAAAATSDGRLGAEIEPIVTPGGRRVAADSLIRPDTSTEAVARLAPVFDPHGTVTAANASSLTDGAAAVVITTDEQAERRGLQPKVWLRSWAFTSHPHKLGVLLGPAYALPVALDKAGLGLADLGLIDLHEAFAGQVLANLAAMADDEFARSCLGRDRAIGAIDRSLLNVAGGSVAIGHPFGATGARIALQLANEMVRRDVQYGALAICAGGARGAAMVLERAI
ncbi:MAG TPA: acetyl-CoA C-acyltransferase [Acidimicrobiales bacterium]|nr:acetyl-CoA C-acyltransferase [Acidimicrobiales bacterium]